MLWWMEGGCGEGNAATHFFGGVSVVATDQGYIPKMP